MLPIDQVFRAVQVLAYVYFEDEAGRRMATQRLARDEAPRIAFNIAKLPSCYATSADAGSRK